jgi:hypothetical protein
MKKSKPISTLIDQILPEFGDPPADQSIQSRLSDFWRDDSGIIAPFTRPFLYKSGRLVIFCDSSTWSTQVRHQSPSLLKQIKEQGFFVSEIVIRTIPESRPQISKQQAYSNSTSISAENAKSLDELSKGINHKRLKESISKLAKKYK